MTWKDVEASDPELYARGAELLQGLCYLATTKKDGSPRVHPIVPLVGEGRIFIFMEPTSPKGHDLQRDDRYALHSSVNPDAANGELLVTGRAEFVEDADVRELASRFARYPPPESDVLFEIGIDRVLWTAYDESGNADRRRWKRDDVRNG